MKQAEHTRLYELRSADVQYSCFPRDFVLLSFAVNWKFSSVVTSHVELGLLFDCLQEIKNITKCQFTEALVFSAAHSFPAFRKAADLA